MGIAIPRMALGSFLQWEAVQGERHEYYRGEIFAMVGGTRGHNRIIANLARHLGNHLDGSPCQVFAEAMKVQIAEDAVVYPDVFVTCDEHFAAGDLVVTSPVLVAEVLSPSTEAYDRGRKFALYRQLASLREYLLIDPELRSAELFRRSPDGSWTIDAVAEDGILILRSVDLALPLRLLFSGMEAAAG